MGGGAAVALPARVRIRLRARADTRPSLRARADTFKRLRGHEDMAIRSDFEFYRGEDVALEFVVLPVPVDVSGQAIAWKMAAEEGEPALLSRSAALTNPTGGVFTVSLARADTLDLPPGTYAWEARRTDPGANTVYACGRLDLLLERVAP